MIRLFDDFCFPSSGSLEICSLIVHENDAFEHEVGQVLPGQGGSRAPAVCCHPSLSTATLATVRPLVWLFPHLRQEVLGTAHDRKWRILERVCSV